MEHFIVKELENCFDISMYQQDLGSLLQKVTCLKMLQIWDTLSSFGKESIYFLHSFLSTQQDFLSFTNIINSFVTYVLMKI